MKPKLRSIIDFMNYLLFKLTYLANILWILRQLILLNQLSELYN